MALQLSPLAGTIAFSDRMGDAHPDLVKAGRIIQGHSVSGPLSSDTENAINRDLSRSNLAIGFSRSHTERSSSSTKSCELFSRCPRKQYWSQQILMRYLTYKRQEWESTIFDVERVKTLSGKLLFDDEKILYDYGMALIENISFAAIHHPALSSVFSHRCDRLDSTSSITRTNV